MFPIPDALAAFYLICFAVGLIFVLLSLFLGLSHDTLHLPGFDHGGAGDGGVSAPDHMGGSGDAGVELHDLPTGNGSGDAASAHALAHATHGVSPINISTVMAFLTWFGGAGYILRAYAGVIGFLSVAIATLVGIAGGAIIFFFLVKVLLPGQRVLDPEDYRMEGTVARVTVAIAPDQTGEIVYDKGGSLQSDGARSSDGSAIEHGTEVVIVRYERGIAYVEPWKSFVARG